jgi:amino-acid N-acetyltransferase
MHTIRKGSVPDIHDIEALVNAFAEERLMLHRSAQAISLALDDYVVAADARGRVLACGALREYSPSVAEVSSIAVAREMQGQGLGRAIVRRVEELARQRGYEDVFLVTTTPDFFETLGYIVVPSNAYPEKRCAHEVSMATCAHCAKLCMWRPLVSGEMVRAA